MGIIEKTATTLVVQYRPWLEWLIGTLFVGGGSWVVASGERVFGGLFVVAGAAIILAFANTVTSRFDRGTNRFTRSLRGVVRRNEKTYPLDEIVSVRVRANSSGSSPSKTYSVVLGLKSREYVPVLSGSTSGKADKEQLAAEIRRFLNITETVQEPPGFGEMLSAILNPRNDHKGSRK